MPARDPNKEPGYYCDSPRHKPDCPDRAACDGCLPPCSMRAGQGTSHVGIGRCSRHLGSTKNHVRAAEAVMARRAVASLGLRVVAPMQPEEAILDELHRTINNVVHLEERVRALGDDIYGEMRHVSGVPTGEARPHVLVVMLNEERDRKRRVAADAIKANVSQRHIELMEDDARRLVQGFRAFARLMGWDPSAASVLEAAQKAIQEVAGGMRVVEGSAEEDG